MADFFTEGSKPVDDPFTTGSRPAQEARSANPSIMGLVDRLKNEGISAMPPGMSLEQFRQFTGNQRAVDKFGVTTGLEAGLGAVGGVVGGTAAGPAGAVGGGALGFAAGRSAADIARDLEDIISLGSPITPTKEGVKQAFKNALDAGVLDAGSALGLTAVGRGASGILTQLAKRTGLTAPDVKQAISDAVGTGVGPGAIDVDKPFFNAASKVGGVMPLIGGPLRRSAEIKGLQISENFAGILDDISPPVDVVKLGVRINDEALRTLGARRNHVTALYADMFETFEKMGNPRIVPTEPLKLRAAKILGDIEQLPRTADQGGQRVGIPVAADAEFVEAVERFLRLGDTVTPTEIRALQRNLNRAAKSRSGSEIAANEFRIINDLGQGIGEALESIPPDAIPGNAGQAILAKISAANRAHGEFKTLTQTAAARIPKRVDRNFFSAGFEKGGSAEVDELANLYLSSQSTLRSPQFIQNFENLAGPENRKALARLVLIRAAAPQEGIARVARSQGQKRLLRENIPTGQPVSGSSDIAVFDAAAMRGKLGLAGGESVLGPVNTRQNRQALTALLKGTGVSVQLLDNFLKTAAAIQRSPVGDPSTFLQRRIILSGGPKALIPNIGEKAAGAAAGAGLGMVSVGGFLIGGRAFSRLISTPKGLGLLLQGTKPNLTRQQTLLLADRIRRAMPEEDLQVQLEPGGP